MGCSAEDLKEQFSRFFYFELRNGKPHVTESPNNEHAWLWKHDYTTCNNRNIPKDEHRDIWIAYIQKFKLLTSNGYSIPNYDHLKEQLSGLYKSSDFLLLSTVCGKRYSYYLIDGILPADVLDKVADVELFQKHLTDHYANLYVNPSSEIKIFRAYGHAPILTHRDSRYLYQVFRLDSLRNEAPLSFIEITCHHHKNRRHYAFNNENLARRFVEDYGTSNFGYCLL